MNTVFSPSVEVQIDVLSAKTQSETVPVAMSTTATEVISLIVEKQEGGFNSKEFFLKEVRLLVSNQ